MLLMGSGVATPAVVFLDAVRRAVVFISQVDAEESYLLIVTG